MTLRFTKMHGAGNDFIVLDRRDGAPLPDRAILTRMADRRFGIGCDQIMVLDPPGGPGAVAAYRIFNSDGSTAKQCGNGARCLAAWLHRAGDLPNRAVLDSPAGPVDVRILPNGEVEAGLGTPDFAPAAVPIRGIEPDHEGYRIPIDGRDVAFGAVSLGNPHVVIQVDDVDTAPMAIALALQSHPAFPEGCNVGFAHVVARDRIRLRVVERGAGETLACGSGACAAHAWLRHRGHVDHTTRIELPGGMLGAVWHGDPGETVRLRGPTAFVFEGTWTP